MSLITYTLYTPVIMSTIGKTLFPMSIICFGDFRSPAFITGDYFSNLPSRGFLGIIMQSAIQVGLGKKYNIKPASIEKQ